MVPSTAAARDLPDAQFLEIDGRRLAYTTDGDSEGRPVVFCHGTPGSRLLGRLLDAPATKRGVRVVAPDRPGIGPSEGAPVGIDDWPADVAALLSALGVESAGVIGFSGGAPYALACHRLDAIDHATLVAAAGPPELGDTGRTQRLLGALSRTAPWLAAPLFRLQRWAIARGDPEDALALVADGRPETGAALACRLPDGRLERVDSDHLGTLCVAAERALSGPTLV